MEGILKNFLSAPKVGVSGIFRISRTREKPAKVNLQIETLISEVKPRKQAQNILQFEFSDFTTEQKIRYYQLIKAMLDLQEEVRKIKKDNKKLMERLIQWKKSNRNSRPQKETQMPYQAYHNTRTTNHKVSNRRQIQEVDYKKYRTIIKNFNWNSKMHSIKKRKLEIKRSQYKILLQYNQKSSQAIYEEINHYKSEKHFIDFINYSRQGKSLLAREALTRKRTQQFRKIYCISKGNKYKKKLKPNLGT